MKTPPLDLDAIQAKYERQHGAEDVVALVEELRLERSRLDFLDQYISEFEHWAAIVSYAWMDLPDDTGVREAIDHCIEHAGSQGEEIPWTASDEPVDILGDMDRIYGSTPQEED